MSSPTSATNILGKSLNSVFPNLLNYKYYLGPLFKVQILEVFTVLT